MHSVRVAQDSPPVELDGTVFLATSSTQKLRQYSYHFRRHGLEVQSVRHISPLLEPQIDGLGDEPEMLLVSEPLKKLARFAARVGTYPLLVEDTMLFIEHFNADFESPILPGPDTKRWWSALGNEGVLDLMRVSGRRAARYVCQIGISPGPGQYDVLRVETSGRIADEARVTSEAIVDFPKTNADYFHRIFIPDGTDITLAEMGSAQFALHDYRRKAADQAASLLRQTAIHEQSQAPLFTAA